MRCRANLDDLLDVPRLIEKMEIDNVKLGNPELKETEDNSDHEYETESDEFEDDTDGGKSSSKVAGQQAKLGIHLKPAAHKLTITDFAIDYGVKNKITVTYNRYHFVCYYSGNMYDTYRCTQREKKMISEKKTK